MVVEIPDENYIDGISSLLRIIKMILNILNSFGLGKSKGRILQVYNIFSILMRC